MSGGTTGTPKGAVGRHAGLVAAGLQIHAWLRPVWEDWHDIVLLPPLSAMPTAILAARASRWWGTIRWPSSLTRATCAISCGPSSASSRPFAGVPALFTALLRHPDVEAGKVHLPSIKGCFSGAAPLAAETKQRFEALTGGRIIEGYSLTEAMLACVCNPVRASKSGLGGPPLPDVEIDIVDLDSGARPGSHGGRGGRPPRAPDHDVVLAEAAGDGRGVTDPRYGGPWLYTGDIGYRDADGYLFLVDRKTDLIKTSGYQVWPREIEDVIAYAPGGG